MGVWMGDGDAGRVTNVHSGTSQNVLQVRDVHGSVHVSSVGRRTWLAPAAIVGVAVLVAAGIVAWPHRNTEGPAGLRVTADMSGNDSAPWGYASASTDFPGDELVRDLDADGAGLDRSLARRVRLLDGSSFERQVIRLHLEGPADRSAQVVDIRPAIRESGPPLDGTLVWMPPQGGPADSSQTQLFLDEPAPVVRDTRVDDRNQRVPTDPYFPGKTIKLAPGETHELLITVSARCHSFEYALTVVEQVGPEMREMVVDDNGRPFRVTGPSCSAPSTGSYARGYTASAGFRITAEPNPREMTYFPPCETATG